MNTHILSIIICSFILFSCSSDEETKISTNKSTEINSEYKFMNILVNHEESKDILLINPYLNSSLKFEEKFAKSNIISSIEGRFTYFLNFSNNSFSVFDSGITLHGDHVHVVSQPTWAEFNSEGLLKPSHLFEPLNGEISIFNDGTGSFSTIHPIFYRNSNSKIKHIKINNSLAHHGSMARFNNGYYAVTQDDNSVNDFHKTLPERVYITDSEGNIKYESKIPTKGIHGDASNGKYCIFGSYNGIITLDELGNQFIINNPTNFDSKDILGTLFYAIKSNNFYGLAINKGIYKIDVINKNISILLESNNIQNVKLDFEKEFLIVILKDGNVNFINTSNNLVSAKLDLKKFISLEDVKKVSIDASNKFIYITNYSKNEIIQISKSSFKQINVFKTSDKPYQIALTGTQLDQEKNH